MVSYAGQFRSFFLKRQIQPKPETPSDDQEIHYIHNPKKYTMIDLNDWFNLQQKKIPISSINPLDNSIKNYEEIKPRSYIASKDSKVSYTASPLNDLFPLNKEALSNDEDYSQTIESQKEEGDNIRVEVSDKAIKESNERNKEEEEGFRNHKSNSTDKAKRYFINKVKSSEDNKLINKDVMDKKKEYNYKEIQKENEDNLFKSSDVSLNVTNNQMKDFYLEVKRIEKHKTQEEKKTKIALNNIKPLFEKKFYKNKAKPCHQTDFLQNNDKSFRDIDDEDRESTQLCHNYSNIPQTLKLGKNRLEEEKRLHSFDYNSGFSTQIPYQIAPIYPIYHYGDYAGEPLIKRIKQYRQPSLSNINNSLQISYEMNKLSQDKVTQRNRHISRLGCDLISKKSGEYPKSFSSQSIFKSPIKRIRTKDQSHKEKNQKELLYYQELREQLNKLNEQYIARYKQLHPIEVKKEKNQKQFQSSTSNNEISNSNSCSHNSNNSMILPHINKPLIHSASQAYYHNINITKSTEDLHRFMKENKLKGLFGDYQTFNSKITQIRSLLKR